MTTENVRSGNKQGIKKNNFTFKTKCLVKICLPLMCINQTSVICNISIIN